MGKQLLHVYQSCSGWTFSLMDSKNGPVWTETSRWSSKAKARDAAIFTSFDEEVPVEDVENIQAFRNHLASTCQAADQIKPEPNADHNSPEWRMWKYELDLYGFKLLDIPIVKAILEEIPESEDLQILAEGVFRVLKAATQEYGACLFPHLSRRFWQGELRVKFILSYLIWAGLVNGNDPLAPGWRRNSSTYDVPYRITYP